MTHSRVTSDATVSMATSLLTADALGLLTSVSEVLVIALVNAVAVPLVRKLVVYLTKKYNIKKGHIDALVKLSEAEIDKEIARAYQKGDDDKVVLLKSIKNIIREGTK